MNKSSILQTYFIAGAIFFLFGCSYEFPEPNTSELGELENANLENTVFLGSTWFSGVNNGALTTNSSKFSLPQILHNHLLDNKNSEWLTVSPSVETINGFNIYENNDLTGNIGQYALVYPSKDASLFQRIETSGEPFGYSNNDEVLANLSFPYAQISDFTEDNSNNPFIASFFSDGSSLLSKAVAQTPTFFVLNLGFEDILSYSTAGADGNINSNSLVNFTYEDALSETLFENKLEEVVETLLDSDINVKGALFNIPNFLNFPHFIEVGYDITPFIIQTPLYQEVSAKANEYNSALDSYYARNPDIPFAERRPYLDFALDRAYKWGILVVDEDLPDAFYSNGQPIPKVRHMTRKERVFYSVRNQLNVDKGHFPTNALTESEYLKESDIDEILNKIDSYNAIIQDIVAQSDDRLALVDVHGYYEELYDGLDIFLGKRPEGVEIEGVSFFPGISRFGIFSADGINLNPRGNALITSLLINTLESKFGGDIRDINPNNFQGTPIENGFDE